MRGVFLVLITCLILGGCQMEDMEKKEGVTEQIIIPDLDEKLFYQNPLGISGIGDPFILKSSDGKYYCYATSDAKYGFYAWVSHDMVTWEKHHQRVFSSRNDGWANGDFWAPEVYEWDGKYYMYYSARWKETESLRIGLAISDSPLGPFEDISDQPLFDFGYAVIDASILVDGESVYLYYARDCSENKVAGRNESHIYGVELSKDGQSVIGEPVFLLAPEQEWEVRSGDWRWNEGPYVIRHDGIYYMQYSGNFYADRQYSVGYATSMSPLGDYVKADGNPVLVAPEGDKSISGSGHNMLLPTSHPDYYFNVYHTHTIAQFGGGDRSLNVDLLRVEDGGQLWVSGPSADYRLKPLHMEKALAMMNEYDVNLGESSIEVAFHQSERIRGIILYGINDSDVEKLSIRLDEGRVVSASDGYVGSDSSIFCIPPTEVKEISISDLNVMDSVKLILLPEF